MAGYSSEDICSTTVFPNFSISDIPSHVLLWLGFSLSRLFGSSEKHGIHSSTQVGSAYFIVLLGFSHILYQ